MKIITCASYYGTGSSAVTDLFTECNNILSLGEYEYRFLQDPDGISDLEYNIVENNNRHNTSDSIKRFIKYTDSLKKRGYGGYDIFGDIFYQATKQYVDEITELKTYAWWNKDRIDKGRLFYFIDRLYSFSRRVISGNLHTEKRYSLLKNREFSYYSAIDEEQFLDCTKRYVEKLISSVNKKNLPYVMVDQMVPPTNTKRYLRYFNDVKIIVVDRDPRDLFLLERTVWEWGVIPVKDVTEFVQWFKLTRRYSNPLNEDNTKVIRIRFEDLVYQYEKTKRILFDFIGINEQFHVYPFTKFNPAQSKKNTNLKKKINGFKKEINFIEEKLKNYLYDFPDE